MLPNVQMRLLLYYLRPRSNPEHPSTGQHCSGRSRSGVSDRLFGLKRTQASASYIRLCCHIASISLFVIEILWEKLIREISLVRSKDPPLLKRKHPINKRKAHILVLTRVKYDQGLSKYEIVQHLLNHIQVPAD